MVVATKRLKDSVHTGALHFHSLADSDYSGCPTPGEKKTGRPACMGTLDGSLGTVDKAQNRIGCTQRNEASRGRRIWAHRVRVVGAGRFAWEW